MTGTHQPGSSDPVALRDPADVRSTRPARRAVAAALAAGTVLLAAACTSGAPSSGSITAAPATTSASASPAPSAGAGSTQSSSPSTPTSASPVGSSTGAAATSGTTPAGDDAAGAAYCASKGGQVQTRDATFGTNGPQTSWLPLAGTVEVCRFQADDEARSRIYVDFATITSARPTLAGLAYLSRPPVETSSGGGNPATAYCSRLGGSSTFGEISANGGGWVNKDDPDDVVVGLCVFPDQSFIDEWGLSYHSGGVVRGQDLTQVMTYQPPDPLPAVFPVGTPTGQPTAASSGGGGSSSTAPAASSAPTS